MGGRERWWAIAAVLLAALLWSPALTPVHVEGFSAGIQAIGQHMADADSARFDRVFPFNHEFFLTSRLGMNLVAAAAALSGLGEWGLRLADWAGLLGLVAASTALARRWGGSSTLTAFATLILLPGVGESAFFYNDNLPSAALVAWALLLAETRPARLGLAAAGGLFGAAVVMRPDAVLLAPAFALLRGLHRPSWRVLVRDAGLFGLAVLSVLAAVRLAVGFDFLDVMRVASRAVALWERDISLVGHLLSLGGFLGLPGLVLAAVGLTATLHRRAWGEALLLLGVPVLYNTVCLGKMWEIRQLLPLTPFIASLMVRGLGVLAAPTATRARALLLALVVAVSVAPPTQVRFSDGPRSLTGRLWTPVVWGDWQEHVRSNFARLDAFLAGQRGNTVAITNTWNSDRYLHLRLLAAGYTLDPAPGLAPDCAPAAEVFRKDGSTLLHLRLHTPFMGDWVGLLPDRFARYAPACLAALPQAEAVLLTPLAMRPAFPGTIATAAAPTAVSRVDWLFARPDYDTEVVIPLNPAALAVLIAEYRDLRRVYADHRATMARPPTPHSLEESERALAPWLLSRP